MTDETNDAFVGAETRALTLGAITTRDASDTFEGERVYWALAYRYDETDTYNTTMQRGALAHVTAGSFPILEHHAHDRDPIGRCVEVDEQPEGLWVGFVLAPTARGAEIGKLIDGGFFRGVSVGFIPETGFKRKADGVTVYTRVNLLELSVVNCPSSQGALIDLTREFGVDQAALEAVYADVLTDEPDTRSAVDAAIETIRTELENLSTRDVAFSLTVTLLSTDEDDEEDCEDPTEPDVEPDEAISAAPVEMSATVEVAPRATTARDALRRLRRR